MGNLGFLTADEALSMELPWPDVYFTPAYGKAAECSDRAHWEVAVWDDGPILYPYLRRPISAELTTEDLFDVTSPYGYSGIWAPPDVGRSQWRDFRIALRRELRDRGAVSEFLRISELTGCREKLLESDPGMQAVCFKETVAVDVAQSPDLCWQSAEGRSRTAVRKARRLGYAWSTRPARMQDVRPDSTFRRLYEQTMNRVSADAYYRFPESYYRQLIKLPEPGLRYIEVVDSGEEPVAAGLIMCWKPFLHLHLVGSLRQAVRDGAGNLLYDGLIRWACRRDEYATFHLGSGMSRDDQLFRFKRGFGGRVLPFWTARSVVDPERNRRLTERRARCLHTSTDKLEASGYFPAYRASAA